MPPVNQSSRTALVTWTVVTTVLFVVTTILSIYFYVAATKATEQNANLTKSYGEVLAPESLTGEDIDKLRAARADTKAGMNDSMKLMDVALTQRNNLAKAIVGSDDPSAANAAIKPYLDKAKAAGAKVAGDSLGAAIDALVTQVNATKAEAANNAKDSADSKTKLNQTLAATQAQIESLTKTMEALRAEKDQALQQVQQITDQQRTGFSNTAEELRQQLTQAQEQITQLNSQTGDLGAKIKQLENERDQIAMRLNDIRVDPSKAVVQQADGTILRLAGNGICFINLGTGDHVNPGLTFEVYDKNEGIPAPGDPANNENLPVGKASIEVLSVGPTSSQCRITRMSAGTALSEGDLITNVVYDRNTRYNFLVFGNFDLDQNGVATPQDAEVVKRLITQWGGNVVAGINVDTDFVVLGKEPVVPDRPDPNDAVLYAKWQQAVAEADAYADISAKARAYRIPILNQNRFLYFVGYFEQAKR